MIALKKAWGVPLASPLTRRQRDVLRFLQDYIASRGYPPTLREIGDATGCRSTNAVVDHLVPLERKGFISRGGKHRSRTIRILKGAPANGVAPLKLEPNPVVRTSSDSAEVQLAKITKVYVDWLFDDRTGSASAAIDKIGDVLRGDA